MSGINKVIFGTTMLGIGALGGYFVSSKLLQKQYQKDVKYIRDFYFDKLDELGVMPEDFEPSDEKEGEDEEDEEDEGPSDKYDEEVTDVLDNYRGGKRRYIVDYTKPSLEYMSQTLKEGMSVVVGTDGEEYLGDVDDDDDDDDYEYTPSDDPDYEEELEQMAEDYARRRSENMLNGEPYLIEPEEYQDGPEGYEHQALYYYSEDRVLCEDDDTMVEDEEDCVGFDYEDKLDMQTTCWVRNDKLRVLYEIHRIDELYRQAVLGVIENPREREFRIQGRRKQAMDDK